MALSGACWETYKRSSRVAASFALVCAVLLAMHTSVFAAAPVLASIGHKTITVGSTLSFTATATDADSGQTLTFSLDSGAPSGASITSGGVFSWTPSAAQGPDTVPITVRVTDNGTPTPSSDTETICVIVNEGELRLPPSVNFDLTHWNLMLPVNTSGQLSGTTAREVEISELNAGFEYVDPIDCDKKYFYTGTNGTIIFEAPHFGAGSGNHPRSELRAMLNDVDEDNWTAYNSTTLVDTHVLDAICAVNEAGTAKIIIGQIHGENLSDPPVSIYYDNRDGQRRVRVAVYNSPGGTVTHTTLLTGVPVHTLIHYQLKIVGTGTSVSLTVTANGVTHAVSMGSAWTSTEFYFKAGCYHALFAGTGVLARVTFSKLVHYHFVQGTGATTRYVYAGNTTPVAPYTNQASAAKSIQEAVDVSSAGDTILVGDGVYFAGGRSGPGQIIANRVVVDKAVTIKSSNGPNATVIKGYKVPTDIYGNGAVRGVYLTNGAVLSGFSITNGSTRNAGDFSSPELRGGGIWFQSGGIATNCILTGDTAALAGGGAGSTWPSMGTLNNCLLIDNTIADNGQGGAGAYSCVVNNSVLARNIAPYSGGGDSHGGGAQFCTLSNCVLTNNYAFSGGGAEASTLYNCTLVANSSGSYGGGTAGSQLRNCILWANTSGAGSTYANEWGGAMHYSCSSPLASGTGNISTDPTFVDQSGGNLRLASGSPCINTGHNSYAQGTVDLDGYARISGGTVDMGAYEVPAFNLDTPGHTLQTGYQADGLALSRVHDGTYGTLLGGTVVGEGYSPVGVGRRAMVRSSGSGSDIYPQNLCTCVPEEAVRGIAAGTIVGYGGSTGGMYPLSGTTANGWTTYLCGNNTGQARGISPTTGVAVGYYWNGSANAAFCRLLSAQSHTALPGLLGATMTVANAINDNDVIVGMSGSYSAWKACVWKKVGGVYQITQLPELANASSEALGLNAAGNIVGYGYRNGVKRPCMWVYTGSQYVVIELPNLTTTLGGQANDIGENGHIVGTCLNSSSQDRACVWRNGGIYDLNGRVSSTTGNIDTSYVLKTATKISNLGKVSGTFDIPSASQSRIYLLTPE